MSNQILEDIDRSSSRVTFLVGENGAGKSRELANLATQLLDSGRRVIAVSNTIFDRFPRSRRSTYARLSPGVGKWYANDVFKRALLAVDYGARRNASLI